MVARAFHGADPIGKRIKVFGMSDSLATIVGVLKDYQHYRLPTPMGPAAFFPYASYPVRQMTIAIRTTGDPHAIVPVLRAAVKEIDSRVPLYQVQTFEEVVTRSFWRQRLQGNVLSVFAVMALVLACVGLYGVIAYAVAQRTRELGVRMALGATQTSVLRLVLGQSLQLVAGGVFIGLTGAWFAVRVLGSLLYGVEAHDARAFVGVPLLLGLFALLSAFIPSRRATKVDPMIAMRAD
jgi:ABC-type antimicrobial peptide transport system permease subunit